MSRAERIKRLRAAQTSFLGEAAKERAFTNDKQTKLGRDLNYILFDPKENGRSKVDVVVQGDNNPGMTLGSDGSQLRVGPTLNVTTRLSNVTWGDGKAVNPLFEFLPPNIVNYYPTMIPDLGDIVDLGQALKGFI